MEVIVSKRSEKVASFKVMDVLRRANELQSRGEKIIHLEVGQPKNRAPQAVVESAKSEVDNQLLGYTDSAGILVLRERICQHYKYVYNVNVSSKNVMITTGSSGAFLLAFMSAFDEGDRVAVASASYPCYRNILNSLGCEVVTIPINKSFKVTSEELICFLRNENLEPKNLKRPLKGLILSSPSNPTGTMLNSEEIKNLIDVCTKNGILFISDEIYHGITFGGIAAETALAFSSQCIVINSFSKYYCMTGWRLGWMIIPDAMIDACNRLMQNLYINAPTLSQIAAISAFDCYEELDRYVKIYEINRNILRQGLEDIGFKNLSPSDGAFYIYADTSDICNDSVELSSSLLENCGVAVTPGTDFEDPASSLGSKRLRFSFCGSTEEILEAVQRMKCWWPSYNGSGL